MEAFTATPIPLALQLGYTAFMAVLIPVYWKKYGWTNFLYFCDVALLLTLAGVWLQSPLLISMATAGILLPQLFWLLDFFAHLAGQRVTGMTDYMFDSQRSRFLRGLSLFHGWLPLLLLWLLRYTGYDERALLCWTALATALVLYSYAVLPAPSRERGLEPVNVNYVYGFSDDEPQRWMPQWAWLLVAVVGFPLALYLPAHLLLRWAYPLAH